MELPKILTPPRGRVLVVAPHPDDESCGIGGTIALHRLQGDPVHILFVTDGIAGDPEGRQQGSIAGVRRGEAAMAAQVLGGCSTEFLGLPDGCEVTPSDLQLVADHIDGVLDRFQPDLLYVPWQEEAHSDHANTCRALYMAVHKRRYAHRLVPRILEYEVWSPLPADWVVDITATAEVKRQAMLAHRSQIAYTDYPHQLMGLSAHRSVYLPKTSRYGEAFREGKGSSPA
jgi:LmbE family N-acetylglucosaminyl deacetylase